MIDLGSLIFVNPESIQAPYSITGIQPGGPWRQAKGLHPLYFPGIARLLKFNPGTQHLKTFGSGVIIGCIDRTWLVIATAAHNLHGHGPNVPPPLPGLESREARMERLFPRAAMQKIIIGVTIWSQQREVYCKMLVHDLCVNPAARDTALLFAKLDEDAAGLAQTMMIDVAPPPVRYFPLITAGFTEPPAEQPLGRCDNGFTVELRTPIVREGFLLNTCGDPVESMLVRYPVARIGIPIAPGMSGGPVIIHRPTAPGRIEPVVVFLNTSEREMAPQEQPESFATPVIALWRQDVVLPDKTWIPFAEAVRHGYIAAYGPYPHRVIYRNGRLEVG